MKPFKQTENRVWRTYSGGKQLEAFLGKEDPKDSVYPEDWISSFVEAKNKNYIPGEGLSRVLTDEGEKYLAQLVEPKDFGPGRKDSGVLVKFLDAGERLGIQVHPTPEFSRKHFGTNYGKTECWHILQTDPTKDCAVYIGFKEGITKERFAKFFHEQDIPNMLASLHRFSVKPGDTILVTAGTPHAIGAGCFLLEIQEPCDYTMRVETTTVAGEKLTPMQISYGLGENALLECFSYVGLTEEEARKRHFLQQRIGAQAEQQLVTYEDTSCFALSRGKAGCPVRTDCFCTVVAMTEGCLMAEGERVPFRKGEKIFVPYGNKDVRIESGEALLCYPPKV